MEWDSEMPPWDLPEIDQSSGEANLSLDCSVDLKLGSLGGFEWAENLKEQRRASTAAASFSKRPRAPSNGGQNALCLVDDCKSDLSGCREYHRRHKVCELHSKTPIVKVGGQEQRFCQQCSRFHLLIEFDDVKRSCRKRLDGHNRRRRKPQPEPTNAEILFPNHHGFRLISYPPNPPSTSIESTFINMTKTEERTCHSRQYPLKLHFTDRQYFATAINESLEKGKQFPFLKDGGNMAINNKMAKEKAPLCHPISNTVSSESSSSNNKLILSDRLPLIINSNCALSLLSPSTQTSAINPDHVAPSDRIPIGQPLISNQQDSGSSCSEVENLEMVEVPDAEALAGGVSVSGMIAIERCSRHRGRCQSRGVGRLHCDGNE